MPKEMVYEISKQVHSGIVVQFHNNGDPLLYPDLGYTLSLFRHNIRCFNTNGKLLIEKADQIIGNLETLTISVVQDDPEQEEQYATVRTFAKKKGVRKPILIYRLLGKVDNPARWYSGLPGRVVRRVLHSPKGSFEYEKEPAIPEIGICLDLLTHLAIDRFGDISICVRFDPEGDLRIGHVNGGIEKAWTSEKRRYYIEKHIEQKRSELPGCGKCEYWGVPRGE
jgi:radical SAM protein with 4Fe4S-binding SPASM domain